MIEPHIINTIMPRMAINAAAIAADSPKLIAITVFRFGRSPPQLVFRAQTC